MAVAAAILTGCGNSGPLAVRGGNSDLQFNALARSWDEAIPLGNGVVGALVWQRDSVLRFSLDRTDLWDLRPMDSIAGDNNRFAWVVEQVRNIIRKTKCSGFPKRNVPLPKTKRTFFSPLISDRHNPFQGCGGSVFMRL